MGMHVDVLLHGNGFSKSGHGLPAPRHESSRDHNGLVYLFTYLLTYSTYMKPALMSCPWLLAILIKSFAIVISLAILIINILQ